ncbi:Iron-sulfur cluster-binding protein [hydrothermal vent metagenome]|uniref:Iron-sulfur cluster-binding protein n=1 Tax=hydrothermal vent metagenome TaxID=652676 RepID=A0A3B1CEA8_9ZZZZ
MPEIVEQQTGNLAVAAAGKQDPFVSGKIDSEWLKKLCLDSGADDVGLVEIGREALADQRDDILSAFPRTKTLIAIVCRLHRESVRAQARNIANTEFHVVGHRLNSATRKIMRALEDLGVWSVSDSWGFPMNVDAAWPGKMWIVSQKPVAVEAGLGKMGLHRSVLHPKYGVHIYLAVIMLEKEATAYDRPVDFDPCLKCNLCAAVCPSGAIAKDGNFDFSSCFTHDYREKLGGFADWVENIVKSKDEFDYRKRVSERETVSMWQNLSFGGNDKCAYCFAVCPAGENVRGGYEENKDAFVKEVVKPLQAKKEKIFVIPGSDAEEFVARRFAHKDIARVSNGIRPRSIEGFLSGASWLFQRGRSEGLDATYHFTFTGAEQAEATIMIKNKTIDIKKGHQGDADLHITADSQTWLGFLAKEKNLAWAMITRKIKTRGSISLFPAFGKCFPS